jgi:hypothetical protein
MRVARSGLAKLPKHAFVPRSLFEKNVNARRTRFLSIVGSLSDFQHYNHSGIKFHNGTWDYRNGSSNQ